MPTAPDNGPGTATPDTQEVDDLVKLGAGVDEKLDQALDTVGLRDAKIEAARTPNNKIFGRSLNDAVRRAAETVAGCTEDFEATGVTPKRLLANQRKLRQLEKVRASFTAKTGLIDVAIANTRADLIDDTNTVVKATRAIMDFPGENHAAKRRVQPYAVPLLAVVEARKASASARRSVTTAMKNERRTEGKTVDRLKLENKFLSGDKLRPEDVTGQPGATPPKKRTRRSSPR